MSEAALESYETYIRKYAGTQGITEEEAKSHALCEEVRKYYEEQGDRVHPEAEQAYETGNIGCER